MTKPRTYQTSAIVIKKTKLGEADRILTLYTPELGKIQGVAKEIQKLDSKSARWIAADAIRELTGEAVQARLAKRAR
jgi:recombinational DNA repair protein (RecF pathway)